MHVSTLSAVFLALLTLTLASSDLEALNDEVVKAEDNVASSCTGNADVVANTLHQLRDRVISKNSKMLVKLLASQCHPNMEEVLRFHEFLITMYNADLVRAIYVEATDVLYTLSSTEALAANLWQLYRKGNMDSFRTMLESQLYLHSKLANRGDINDSYLLNVGYYFYKAKQDPLYAKLDGRLRDDLNTAIGRMPSTLQFFYFEREFCLHNKGYGEYMYTADGMYFDDNRRFIFNWVPAGGDMSQGAWLKSFQVAENATNAGGLPFKVALKGRKFGKYMFMDKDNDMLVAAWEPGYQPEGAAWSVQLVEGALVFEQNGYLMCASQMLYKYNERRYIYGYDDKQHSESNEYCQWNAVVCPLK